MVGCKIYNLQFISQQLTHLKKNIYISVWVIYAYNTVKIK